VPFDNACGCNAGVFRADASRLRLLLLLRVPPLRLSPSRLRPVSSGSTVLSLDLGVSFFVVCFLWRGLCTPGGGVCRFLFPRQVIPYFLGTVCQALLPKGECHHWQVFFPLKEVFPAVSPLSPMSGWQKWNSTSNKIFILDRTSLRTWGSIPAIIRLICRGSNP